MDKQPTAILILFTDYLDNRDSIAFLRLSSCVFSSHRSPTGRYRLKPRRLNSEFQRPSALPSSFFLPSLHSGHYLCDSWRIENSADLAFFNSPEEEIWPLGNEEIREKTNKLKSLQLNIELINVLPKHLKFPNSIEMMAFFQMDHYSSSSYSIGQSDLEAFQRIFPQGVKKIDFGSSFNNTHQQDHRKIDFLGFSRLESLKSFQFPLWPGRLPSGLKELEYIYDQEIPEGSLPDSLECLSFSSYNHPLPSKLPTELKILDPELLFRSSHKARANNHRIEKDTIFYTI